MADINSLMRRMMIVSYFEGSYLGDEEWGIDFNADKFDGIDVLKKEIENRQKKTDPTLRVKHGSYMQYDPGFLPPVGAVFDSIDSETEEDLQTMVETDKFGKVINMFSERI